MPRFDDLSQTCSILIGGDPDPAALRKAIAELFAIPASRVNDSAGPPFIDGDDTRGYAGVYRCELGHFRCWFDVSGGPLGCGDIEPILHALSDRLQVPVCYDAEHGDPKNPFLYDLFFRGQRHNGVSVGEIWDENAGDWIDHTAYLWGPRELRLVLNEATGWTAPEDAP